MKFSVKKIILTFIIGGVVYALGMAAFDYKDGEPFSWNKFLFNTLIFGGLLVTIDYIEKWFKKRKEKK